MNCSQFSIRLRKLAKICVAGVVRGTEVLAIDKLSPGYLVPACHQFGQGRYGGRGSKFVRLLKESHSRSLKLGT